MQVLKYTLVALMWLGTPGAGTPGVRADAPAEAAARGSDGAEPAPANTAPVAGDLIDLLGDPDPKVREAASKRLADLGKVALPDLQKSKDVDDPEIRGRVRSLIRKAERRLPPAAPPRHGLGSRHSVRTSRVNGQRTVDVDDDGYRIQIRQGTAGIEMNVTGVEEGAEVTETYKAKDAEQLKEENPEAFALYEKYNNGGPNRFQVQVVGGDARVQGQVRLGGEGEVQQNLLDIQIQGMERVLQQLDQNPNIPPGHRARVQELVDQLRARQDDVQQKQMQEMQKDREKALDDLKVPLREAPLPEEPNKEEPKKVEPEGK